MLRPILLILCLAASSAPAQTVDPQPEDLFERFMRDAERSLRELFDDAKPQMEGLLDQLRRLPMYEAPEILPNGDIIIRRKRPGPDADDGLTEI